MDLVRKAINDIRAHWESYPQFMRELQEFMSEDQLLSADPLNEVDERLSALFSATMKWADPAEQLYSAEHSAIRLYTSEYGYRKMFSTINTAFRSDELVNDLLTLRCATFLVELLNIDLFNYRAANPHVDNFEGHVYRGMCISAEDLTMFASVTQAPVAERYLSIPLAMASASSDQASALAFALEQASRTPGGISLLWDIRVAGLDPQLLAIYREKFPASIVTSLCAVPISELSDYPGEREVLLRGPHFQILGLNEVKAVAKPPLYVIDAIMLNSNRDHVTAIASNVGEDRRARDLFRAVINAHRATLCAEYAEVHGLSADADSYRSVVSQSHSTIREHTG
jgi:hypothetical protein